MLQLAEGNAPTYLNGFVELTNVANTVASPQQLVESVFANVERNYTNAQWLHERAILTPKNTDVAEMSKKLLLLISGNTHVDKSLDKPCDPSEDDQ